MASGKKRGKRRRVGVWLLALLSSLAVAALFLWTGLRNPYSFLESFGPRHVEVNPEKLLPVSTTLPMAVHRVKPPKTTLLIFKAEQAKAVLAALRRELTREKGYVSRKENEELWSFDLRGKPDEGVVFASGLLGTMQRRLYESGELIGSEPARTPSCIVVVSRNENWLERQWKGLRRILHLG